MTLSAAGNRRDGGKKRVGHFGGGGRVAKKAKNVNAKLSRLQRQVRLLKPDIKYLYTTQALLNLQTGVGSITYISGIGQGVDEGQRIADTVRPMWLRVKVDATKLFAGDTVGYYLVRDKSSNGVLPTISGAATSVLTTFLPTTAFADQRGMPRFDILKQGIVTGESLIAGVMGLPITEWYVPLSGTIEFIDNSVNITGASKNALYFIIIVNTALQTSGYELVTQLAYTDV